MNTINAERRAHQRYSAPSISISLKSVESRDESEQQVHLSAVDFNRFGMAIHSQHNFKIGDKLHIEISDGSIQAIDLISVVCNRAKTEDGYRSGLHFQSQDNSDASREQALIELETTLKGA